jgi:asparagine synthase (glutamine-hydrolysing)
MCGIAGYFSQRPLNEQVIRDMTRALIKRGPDDEGYYSGEGVNLGFRRLAVIDIAGSPQPLYNEDRSLVMVFNGEIYNYRELRQELIAAGHSFRTQGDGEVIVHAYEEYGESMLKKLTGMFAFALWDRSRRSLLLARDQLGVKPLYYYWDGSNFAFGSELKAILKHPGIDREVDLDAIALFLECQYIPAPKSIYRKIAKLRAGHALTFSEAGVREHSYWVPDYREKKTLTDADAVSLLDAELRRSVTSMLVADVPLGAFISGGIDSSLIAAVMTQCAGRAVDTFNLGFTNDEAHSEHRQAEAVAKHIGSNHHVLMIEPRSALDAFEGWTDVFDEPFGDQAALPTLMLSQFARKQVTVALTGEGADEVFAGYGNYRKRVAEERVSSLLGARGSPLPALIRQLPPVLRKDRLLKAIARPRPERYVTIPNVFDEALRESLLSPAFGSRVSQRASQYAARLFEECNSAEYIDRIMYVDLRMWLPDDLLTKVDRATMAYSLEARVPYLDHHLVEFAATLMPDLKQRGRETKYILKKVAERYLPMDIIYRQKQGFHMPLRSWLANELQDYLNQYLAADGLLKRNLFRPEAVAKLLAQHRSGQKDHAIKLWNLLVLEKWFRAYEPEFSL